MGSLVRIQLRPLSTPRWFKPLYYSRSELVELAMMVYLLSVSLTFETASDVLRQLRELEPNFAQKQSQRCLMLVFEESEGILRLRDFELTL